MHRLCVFLRVSSSTPLQDQLLFLRRDLFLRPRPRLYAACASSRPASRVAPSFHPSDLLPTNACRNAWRLFFRISSQSRRGFSSFSARRSLLENVFPRRKAMFTWQEFLLLGN